MIENGKLKSCSGGFHNHAQHTDKITKMINRSQLLHNAVGKKKIKREELERPYVVEEVDVDFEEEVDEYE